MEFPKGYFEDEVREGFYISGMIKRTWAAQMEVLQVIDDICKKHDIRWFADCGTLLGAVRHGGYIPWDDDLDICMLRDEYIRFNKIVRSELPKDYVWLNFANDKEPFYHHITRITNCHRLNFDADYLERYHDCAYAVGVDIFPIDYLCDDEEKEKERQELAKIVMLAAGSVSEDNNKLHDAKDVLRDIERLCKVKLNYKKNIKQQLFKLADDLFSMYTSDRGKNVALMHFWVDDNSHKYPTEYFKDAVMMPFENIEVPIPVAYDGVLRIEYGDYMKINRKGGIHGYPYFEDQEKFLIDLLPEYHFKYQFQKEHLENPVREAYVSPKKQAENFVGLMNQAHMVIIKSIKDGQYDAAIQLLMSCQNSAIQIGTLLEEHYGIGFATVGTLEQYCEVIYQVFEMVQQVSQGNGESIDLVDLEDFLKEVLESISASIVADIPKNKKVLFIGCKADAWDAFDSVWRAAKDEPDTSVYVMPVPYSERNAVGGVKETFYEKNLFPDYLDVVDYDGFDIAKEHPDVIFIQNPYDECNYTTNIMPAFYSERLKGLTDKLVYIPWFKLAEFGEGEEKPRKTMDYFCKVPGVVHADMVIVQSEKMRKEYIECLTEFAGEDTREIWEKKIVGLGTPIDDAEQARHASVDKTALVTETPEAWKEILLGDSGELKKSILYNTSVAAFMQYGDKMLDKIKRTLQIFEANKDDIALIWRPHPLTVESLKSFKPELLDKYNSVVEEYKKAGWGIYDDTKDMELAIQLCDAYYGDSDGVAHKCETLGKLVMLQNVEM